MERRSRNSARGCVRYRRSNRTSRINDESLVGQTVNERLAHEGWAPTIRMISLRVGSAVARRITALPGHKTSILGRAARGASVVLMVSGLAYGKVRGWL